jgi:hypothetical protein
MLPPPPSATIRNNYADPTDAIRGPALLIVPTVAFVLPVVAAP